MSAKTNSDNQQAAASSAAAYQPLVTVLVAACVGIVADRYWGLALSLWSIASATGWLAWWVFWRRDHVRLAAWPLLLAIAAAAGGWHHCRWSLFDVDEVSLLAVADGGPAAIEARVIAGPRHVPAPPYNPLYLFATPDRTRMEIEVLALRDDARWRASTGRTTLFVNGFVEGVQAGDCVRIFGQLSPTREPANPGEYDFAARARVDRRMCWLSAEFPECVSAVAQGSAWSWPRVLGALRDTGDSLLWRNLHGNRSALAAAMFLGSREELQPEETQALLETGTIHLLVISGLNVGILVGCLFALLRVALVPRRWALAVVVAAFALGLAIPLATPRDDERLGCTFLSVGHGAAVVLELPGGQTLLYDAGRLGAPAGASRAVAAYLWSRGITHIDAVVISHADADHYNGVPALLDQFSVGAIYVSPVMFEQRSAALDALREAIGDSSVPMQEVWAGDRLRSRGDVRIEVLHPPRLGVLGSDNANSIVLDVEYAGRRLLLTGDLESQHPILMGC